MVPIDFFGDTIPSALNTRMRPHYITVSSDLKTAKYTGKSRYGDNGTIQAEKCAPTNCKVYYFEIDIVESAITPKIVVGFTNQNYHLHRNPGVEPNSIGYKAEDGNKLCSGGRSESFGPPYGKGDTIGCGVNYVNQTYFFTKNGSLIGNFGPINHTEHYPSAGLGTLGDVVTFNFMGPFKYDLETLINETGLLERQEINKISVPIRILNNLVHLYLLHGGYAETLRAFMMETGSNPYMAYSHDIKVELATPAAPSHPPRPWSTRAEAEDKPQPTTDTKKPPKRQKSDMTVLSTLYITEYHIEHLENSVEARSKVKQLILDGKISSAIDHVAAVPCNSSAPSKPLSHSHVMLYTQHFIEILKSGNSSQESIDAALAWMQAYFPKFLKDPAIKPESRIAIESACTLLAYKDLKKPTILDLVDFQRRLDTAHIVNEEWIGSKCAEKTATWDPFTRPRTSATSTIGFSRGRMLITGAGYGPLGIESLDEKMGLEHLLEPAENLEARFKLLNKHLGEGTYGTVTLAQDTATGRNVAIKRVKNTLYDPKEHGQLVGMVGIHFTTLRELKVMTELNHENLMPMVAVYVNRGYIHIVMDLMPRDLKSVFDAKVRLGKSHIKCIMLQLIKGLEALHEALFCHRDLAPANVFVDGEGVCKIADFGLARRVVHPPDINKVHSQNIELDLMESRQRMTHKVVTLWYRSPELLMGAECYNFACDIWSVGCIFAEMLLERPLFNGANEIDQLGKIFKLRGTPSDTLWPEARRLALYTPFTFMAHQTIQQSFPNLESTEASLLEALLQLDPHKRPSAKEVLQHEYFCSHPPACKPNQLPFLHS
ncbi:bifunctional Protein kinase-like domain superfamily/Tyrosine-protein kinase [Babesia duncani]|uniref:Cyclin-dependent kinase 2 homolog n=1 Tax=Babesia duncani TaxID=323732 RepID=A0AAD9PJ89_9APIC|nr:bifunctional Protein kinase-like domain superfamily/Tyrosine-protein kinase [Babesia duncani]